MCRVIPRRWIIGHCPRLALPLVKLMWAITRIARPYLGQPDSHGPLPNTIMLIRRSLSVEMTPHITTTIKLVKPPRRHTHHRDRKLPKIPASIAEKRVTSRPTAPTHQNRKGTSYKQLAQPRMEKTTRIQTTRIIKYQKLTTSTRTMRSQWLPSLLESVMQTWHKLGTLGTNLMRVVILRGEAWQRVPFFISLTWTFGRLHIGSYNSARTCLVVYNV